MSQLDDAILRHVNDPKYRPVKPRVICKKLGLAGDDFSKVKRAIKLLVKAGRLAYGPSHLVCPVKTNHPAVKVGEAPTRRSSSKHVLGTFRRATAGFGFVRPEGTPAAEGRDADIFVPASATGDATNGDIVRLRISSKRDRMGKPEGRVIDVVERANNRFVGTYFVKSGMGLVQVDGKVFAKPIYVGDPGAKGAQADDKVVVEMVRFPSQVRDGEGVIVSILGQRGQPGVDTLSVIHEFNLPGDFDDASLENARKQAEKFDESITGRRKDLTGETIITIDPATARDFDDAISLDRLDNGHWLLGVHIADVSHFVRPKSALDREAKDRATSVYLPDQVIPMLPEIISNNLASLQPDKVRYAMTARIEFSPEGQRIATDVYKSAIKSCRRFTYEEVDQFLADRSLWKRKLAPPVHKLLCGMHELAMMLRERRMKQGALELSMPELEIDLNSEGKVVGAHLEENTESHQIIEEFMLAANIAVAEMLFDKGVLFLRRVHGSPDPRKLKSLNEFVKELHLETDSLESRFALQALLNDVKGDSRERAVNYAVLRSMQRAVYSPEEEGHYALASGCYCHFTSPIRRYPDLTIHRLIDAVNRGKPPEQHFDDLLSLGDHCSEREQRATEAERELNKVKLLHYLEDKVGAKLEGIVTGVESFGLFVMGTELPAEGFVHISALSDDYYKYDKVGHVIQGFRSGNTYRLGDAVQVAVASVDVERRELDFRLLGKIGDSVHTPAKRPSSAKRGKPVKGTKRRKKRR
ncbi:MAG: ribonuclease R [Planctomycetales bacterium]|nr:ribonuclease R [Planctomycetales bacterium]